MEQSDPGLHGLLRLAATTGARRGQLLALRWRNLDLTDGHAPWRPDRVTHAFARVRRQAGLGHFRLHDLRHFMATQMLAAGIPIALVAQRLNHARISTTANVYTHAIRSGDRPAAETLAALIDLAAADQDLPID